MGTPSESERPLSAALRFLSYRPRSQAEVRRRLSRTFPDSIIDKTIKELLNRGLLDDDSFAKFWRDNREQHRPRSKFLLKRELLRMGVSPEVANDALQDTDDESNALRAGRKLLRRVVGQE